MLVQTPVQPFRAGTPYRLDLVRRSDQGQRMTWPAYERPPPNPNNSTGAPDGISRLSTSFDNAIGMLAADVLPDSTTSLATTALTAPSRFASGSMMRRLAWCSTTPPRSAGAMPLFSQTSLAITGSWVVVQRKTAWPSWANLAFGPSIRTASDISGTEPQTTGPISGSSLATTTAAPAPSPISTQVVRSVQSVKSLSFSTPMTSAFDAAPALMAWSGAAIRRSRMPTRLWIHSSLVSTMVASSSLVSTRSGW